MVKVTTVVIGAIALLALVGVAVNTLSIVAEVTEYNLRGASAVQITQVYSELSFALMQNVIAVLAIIAFVQIMSFLAQKD